MAVENSSAEANVTVQLSVACLKEAMGACTSFDQLGCMLAWLAVADAAHFRSDIILQEFGSLWLRDVAKTKSARKQRKGVTFPLREGELSDLVQIFATKALAQMADAAFADTWSCKAWVYTMMCALNHLAGEKARLGPGRWSVSERRVVLSLESAVQRRNGRSVAHPTSEMEWQKDVGSRQVGYSGEEQSVCHVLTWEQVEPALPPADHGGCIDTLNWVGPRTRDFLTSPKLLLKPQDDVVLPRMPGKIHIKEEDRMRIAHELVARNVCDWIPLEQVYSVKGTKVLNGLFGVAKPSSLSDGRVVLRLIMNLTGSNATQLQLEGGCSSLPSIASWQSIVIDDNQEIRIHQSDMCSAFYLFKLPAVWRGHLAFNIVVDGTEINCTAGRSYALCCNVIPMGWLNSVGVMQEISENLLSTRGLHSINQISRGRALPPWMNSILDEAGEQNCSWWHVYLDNYAGGERITPGDTAAGALQCHELVERAWESAGVVSSAKKRVTAAREATELGAEINGDHKTLGVSTGKLVKVIQATLWMLSRRFLNRKHAQILAGRWIFILQFRRPAMGYLQKTWKFIGSKTPLTAQLREIVKQEFLCLISVAPLLHCNLGAGVSDFVLCTDASESGGSVELGTELTKQGRDFVEAAEHQEKVRGAGVTPILIVSLFNGIGGAFRSYDMLGLEPMGRIAVDIDESANRVTSRRWPGCIMVKDIRSIDRTLVRSWSLKFLRVEEIHLWAGWPCVDLSSVKFGRANLEGPQSSLFWEIPRVRDLFAQEFGSSVVLRHVLENVASMDESAAREISEFMETWPYRVDCADAVPMRRPRFCWTSEDVSGCFHDIQVEKQRYWYQVTAKAEYPELNQWITPGYSWDGYASGAVLPTCLKSIPRRSPPERPAGLEKCNEATCRRWQEDSFRYPPYQYNEKFLFTTNSTWRLVNAEEKELLMGYGYKHTALAWSASRIKQNPVGFSDSRHKLLGDCFSVYSFILFAAACSKRFLPKLSYKHLAKRMGAAPGFRPVLKAQIPLTRSLAYGSFGHHSNLFNQGVQILNRFLLRKTNHTGSDIRVISGDVLNSRAFPRQSVSAGWWKWNHAFHTRWKQTSHINVLELETILLGLKFQITRLKAQDQRVCQFTDSYVGMSVVSKGRSGSLQLTRVLNQISAHLLAFGIQMIIGHIESSENPADEGSRQ